MNIIKSLFEKSLVAVSSIPLLLGVGENSKVIDNIVKSYTGRLKTMFASIELSREQLDKLKICCGDTCGQGPIFDEKNVFKREPEVGLFVEFPAGNHGVNIDSHLPAKGGVSFKDQAEICADEAANFVSIPEESPCYGIKGIVITGKTDDDNHIVSLACADKKNP